MSNPTAQEGLDVTIRHAGVSLEGDLVIPADAHATILMVPGAGIDRRTPRNMFVASELNGAGFATLLFDLLTPAETAQDKSTIRWHSRRLPGRLDSKVWWGPDICSRKPALSVR